MLSLDRTPEPVLFVGAAAHDTIAVVESLPGADERVEADAIVRGGGGPAATAAAAAARLGVPVELATAVGDDAEGHRVLELLEAAGVGVRHAEIRQGESTAQSVAVVSRGSAARCLMVRPGPVLRSLPTGYGWVHVDQAGYAAAAASRHDFARLSVDDGNFIEGLNLSLVDLYVPTLQTLRRRTGADSAAQALAAAHERGAQISVATDGSAGSTLREGDTPPVRVPTLLLDEVVSTLGAGDAFHGALLAGIVLGRSAEHATRLASVCAALACRAIDGRSSLPDLIEADSHLAALGPTLPLPAGAERLPVL